MRGCDALDDGPVRPVPVLDEREVRRTSDVADGPCVGRGDGAHPYRTVSPETTGLSIWVQRAPLQRSISASRHGSETSPTAQASDPRSSS